MKEDRKDNIKYVKNICIYKPSLIERTGAGSRRKKLRSRDNTNPAGFQNDFYNSEYQVKAGFRSGSNGQSSGSGSGQVAANAALTPNEHFCEMYAQAQQEVLDEDRMKMH